MADPDAAHGGVERIDRKGSEGEAFAAVILPDREPISGQWLAPHDVAQFEGEALQGRQRT